MKRKQIIESQAAQAWTKPYYATAILFVVAVVILFALLIFSAMFQEPSTPETPTPVPFPSPTQCTQGTPLHSLQEAKDYLSRVMATYREMSRSDIPTPTYNSCDKAWSAVIRIPSTGGERRTYIRINDTPALLLDNVYLEIVKPAYVSEDRLVTNGTLLLTGKINCSSGSLVRMMEFSDPYCPSCILGDGRIDAFRRQFNDSVDFDYHILPSTMQVMENSYGREDVNRIAYYMICMQKQHLLDDFKPCAVQKYRAKGVEAPLSKEELDSCLPSALNTTEFDACVPTAYQELAFDKSMAETYGVTETPVVLFDCKYRVLPEYMESGFCFTHPWISGCNQ